MIQNESLSDRLNDFKKNQQKPETNTNSGYITHINSIVNSLINLFLIFLKSVVFGFGLKTLINADWHFLGYFCIGMSITLLIEFILDIASQFTNN